MKHSALRSMAHNIADSLADGLGFPIGVFRTDVFDEASRSPEGQITVDFLNGTVKGARASAQLTTAVSLYSTQALAVFCEKHGVPLSSFRELTVRYSAHPRGRYAIVTIE